MPWTAAAIAGAGALSAGSSLAGSGKASKSAQNAANTQLQMYNTTRGDLSPYVQAGTNVLQPLTDLATSRTGGGPDYVSLAYNNYMPGTMTQAQLEATPGYQFTLQQGQKAVQSAAAARGLGVSGASLKSAGDYVTGLADKTYLDQFNVQQQRFSDVLGLNTAQQGVLQNQAQRLQNVASLGESAAAQTGQQGTTAANAAGNYLTQAGLASAAGTTGVSNAVTGAVNNYLGYNALQQYLNPSAQGYASAANVNAANNMNIGFGSGSLFPSNSTLTG